MWCNPANWRVDFEEWSAYKIQLHGIERMNCKLVSRLRLKVKKKKRFSLILFLFRMSSYSGKQHGLKTAILNLSYHWYFSVFPLHYDHALRQGFSTFWYPGTPKSKLYPSAYPQIRIICPSCTPQNQKFYPKGLLLSVFLNFAYPLWPSHVSLGVRVPQVENRCFKVLRVVFLLRSDCSYS